MTKGKKKYRLVAVVGSREITSAWRYDDETVRAELQEVQKAQSSGEAVRLPWLGIASGRDVTAVYVDERWVSMGATVV
jgi:hypothetical protein